MLRIREPRGRKSGGHLDGGGVRVSTSGGTGSRVNTSTGMVSESAPRMETEVESTPRRGWYPSQHLGWKRKSSQRLDETGVRVSISDGNGSRVNTSTGLMSESAPRMETKVESTPRQDWCPSQHLGWKRKSSQHLDRKAQDFESTPRNVR